MKFKMRLNQLLVELLLVVTLLTTTQQVCAAEESEKETRTLKQTWSKVVRFKWKKLDKEDAWNMLQTTIGLGWAAGLTYGGYHGGKYMQSDYQPIIPDGVYQPESWRGAQVITIPTAAMNQPITLNQIECSLMGDGCEEEFLPIPRYQLACGHFVACGNCLRAHIRAHASEGNIGNISCPQIGCDHKITPQEIRNVAVDSHEDRDLISHANQAVVTHQLMEAIRYQNNVRVCHKCNAFFTYQGRRLIHCPSCNAEYCAHCRADRTICNGRTWVCATKRETVAKKCPRCGCEILKNGACNSMICGQCRYNFCWVCLGPGCGHGGCRRFRIRW